MISSMIKYTFLLYHTDQERFIEKIGETGVVDITVGEYTPNDEELAQVADISSVKSVIDSLTNYSAGRNISSTNITPISNKEFVDRYTTSWSKQDSLKATLARLEREVVAAEAWGEFDIQSIENLKNQGINLHFYTSSTKDFDNSFEKDYPIQVISVQGSTVYFVAIEMEGEEFTLPEISCSEQRNIDQDVRGIYQQIEECNKELDATTNELDNLAALIPAMTDTLGDMTITLKKHRIEQGNRREAENTLIIVDGWCPKESKDMLDSVVNSLEGVVVVSEAPTPDDEPPIKLKNSKLFSPAEIITNLFSLPNYKEVDMTPFFAPFFVFFVGICLGDAVYGAVCFIAALVAYFKVKPSLKPAMTLVMWCSFAAIIMGAVTGVYGGETITATQLISDVDMFYFALGVGLLQILYAMILQSYFRVKRFGFVYGLSQIGWTLTLLTVLAAYLLPMMGYEQFSTSSPLFLPLIIVSLVLTIFFQNPKANPFQNFGAGLWFLYNALTGLLSDTLSYVRLFALGLSGGIIAGVFNTLAVELSPDIPVVKYLVMIIILAIGHGINLFMSAISAFVHPLRLTFVEFYKNVGFEGGGRAYDPVVNKIVKE